MYDVHVDELIHVIILLLMTLLILIQLAILADDDGDRELVMRIHRGDQNAFRAFFDKYKDRQRAFPLRTELLLHPIHERRIFLPATRTESTGSDTLHPSL